ncbi:MAG: TlpA family protein disulfide reductase [Anaerolineae bacterium]
MWQRRGFVLVGVVVLAIVATACGVARGQSAGTASGVPVGSNAGMRAPDFTLTEVTTGEPVSLSQFRGRPVLINFWATWCGPCRLEMPHLQAAYEQYRDEGFTVLAVDVKFDDGPEAVQAFIDELGLTFPIVKDEAGVVEIDKYNVLGYPTSVFIDRDGVIQYVHRGPLTKDFIAEKLKDIL